MELLSSLDSNALFLLCGGCVVVAILLVVLPFFMNIIGVIFNLLEFVTTLINLGPVPGCGCVMLLLGCGCTSTVGYVLINALSTCGTPQAVNFCQFFN